jgi:hypothetical protein
MQPELQNLSSLITFLQHKLTHKYHNWFAREVFIVKFEIFTQTQYMLLFVEKFSKKY